MNYSHFYQLDNRDCGPTCLRMICKYYGRDVSEQYMHKACYTKRTGTTMLGISDAAEELGFKTCGLKITINQLYYSNQLPCIIQWNQSHFIVVYKITEEKVVVGDPAAGILTYPIKTFCKSWYSTQNNRGENVGIVLFLEPQKDILDKKENNFSKNLQYKKMASYLGEQKKMMLQLLMSIIIAGFINLIFPFLTQSIVDIGIQNQDVRFVVVVLLCQLSLSMGSAVNSYVSSWYILHISSRISISLVNDFLGKLMRLPVAFFSKRMIGDLLQRINDFSRIENFLTTTTISILVAVLSFIVYGYVLLRFGIIFVIIFVIGSMLYVCWIIAFLRKRKKIDYMRFQENAENQSNVIHMINGMQEIKLNNCEDIQLNKWQAIQLKLYKINIQGLSLAQIQSIGGMLIDNTKNILITFWAAWSVMSGDITLGMMMAIQYLVGQLNGPLSQVISFIQSLQDTKISMERVNEINMNEDEDEHNKGKVDRIPHGMDIVINHVDFHYNGPRSPKVLNDVNFVIKGGKITAIVGESGSGKTTLLKLILGFYEPSKGEIYIGNNNLKDIDKREWKKKCGVVMQNGYIFSEPIRNNIGLIDKDPDMDNVRESAQQACIHEFITSLPLQYDTVIGSDGNSLSMGQKQRILIARAIYKNAPYIFFDEATNSLDANNEKCIIQNLSSFYNGKTVLIIAHRMSTVINADNIIVMNKGHIIEQGTHNALINAKGYYYSLVKEQLNIGE